MPLIQLLEPSVIEKRCFHYRVLERYLPIYLSSKNLEPASRTQNVIMIKEKK